MDNKKTGELTAMAAIAAMYVALCYAFAFMSYGLVQFRIAEVLLLLPFYNKKYCVPIILGTFAANMLNGVYDMLLGTLATVLVLLVIVTARNKIIIAPAAAAINGIVIGLMLHYIFEVPYALWFCVASVALGEFAVVLAGVLAFAGIEKVNPQFIDMLKRQKME